MPETFTPEERLSKLRWTWLAVLPVPALFYVAALVAKPPKEAIPVGLPILALVAAAIFVVAIVLPPRAARARLARFPLPPNATSEERALAADRAAFELLRTAIGPSIAVAIVGFAAIHWLHVGLLGLPFWTASYVALGYNFPTHAKVVALPSHVPERRP